MAIAAGVACLGLTIVVPPRPLLIWNASASAPIGLYLVSRRTPEARGEMALAWPPDAARELAARRGYLPAGVPLVKRVAAIEGDTVCAHDRIVTVNGAFAASRRSVDRLGRPLPAWQGCVSLARGMLFLLIADRSDSFDGRYFGATDAADVIGKARPLWLR
ncbi:conjugative transfer signal peptidase TraF [Sphingosinicella sp. BN140058]|uniref:conjugative transfer signal peptidase TraF n=1 Tax=Sphingosinicella sp. BN140058 TaxID=1892855 RepID=UPI0010107B59|nr:conjugative transfer signal peptidase TraF [Sphingosinicella sp. BN140058]QAY79966.1 conjugative transfer signal peptidase TraF [Sphingosinicella sp. BN140058]